MTVSARIRLVRATLTATVVIVLAPVFAQVPEQTPMVRPLRGGPFLLYPFFTTEVEHDDNLFLTETDQVATASITATPGILAELPSRTGNTAARIGYALRFREYEAIRFDNPLSHFFTADGRFGLGAGFVGGAAANYERGVLDTRRFDPGGEATFEGDDYQAGGLEFDVGHERGNVRRIALVASRNLVRFLDRPPDTVGFFDSDADRLGVTGKHRRGNQLWVLWSVRSGKEKRVRPIGDLEERRDIREFEVSGGVRMQVSMATRLDLQVAYTDNKYDSANPDTFRGPLWQFLGTRVVPTRGRISARLERIVFPSIYRANNFYVSDQFNIQYDNDRQARIGYGALVLYHRNSYPEDDDNEGRRLDRLLEGQVWIGYRFRPGLEWRVYAGTGSRASSIDRFNFNATRVGTWFAFGI